MHEACASIIGTHQSPINICEADCFEIRDALLIEAYDDESTRGCITGHDDHYTFELDVPGEGLRAPAVQFRSTKATLRSIHFHALSEHQLEKQKFSAEFHLVHEICSQATATDQYGQEPSSKIVIGVFANEVDDNEALQSLSLEFCKSLSIVKNAKEKSCVSDPFSFAELLKDAYSKLERFYHYRGSLSVQETFCKSGQKGETSVN
ncbi:MAG TPA: carbonic anhydrase family protein, partial [Candidatus Obscuribacter sp.]|nr:carbonic anhydrase family protein [Candidatus Obscuribacter sp.]